MLGVGERPVGRAAGRERDPSRAQRLHLGLSIKSGSERTGRRGPLRCGQPKPGRKCAITGQKNEDDGTQGASAPGPVHADPGVDEDEAWEGFALDVSVFRSGDGHQKD